MLAHDSVDGTLPAWLSADQKPKRLRGIQRVCGEPSIPGVDRLALISACQIGICDREVEVVLQGVESQQLQLGLRGALIRPHPPEKTYHPHSCQHDRGQTGDKLHEAEFHKARHWRLEVALAKLGTAIR